MRVDDRTESRCGTAGRPLAARPRRFKYKAAPPSEPITSSSPNKRPVDGIADVPVATALGAGRLASQVAPLATEAAGAGAATTGAATTGAGAAAAAASSAVGGPIGASGSARSVEESPKLASTKPA